MAARPAGRAGPGGRFAQFKLVLLGESAVGKVCSSLYPSHDILTNNTAELVSPPLRQGSIRRLPRVDYRRRLPHTNHRPR